MDALIVLLVIMAAALVFDALALFFGQDSRSLADDEWARPWSSAAAAGREC
jgi:hypothetical protein